MKSEVKHDNIGCMERSCPYCATNPRNSDDHVFSEFLGGTATIRACKPCNDTFGHTFEGALSHDLAPLMVTLRRGGLHAPRRVVWKRALKYGDGQADYDLDSDLNMSPSRPIFEASEDGKKRVVAPSEQHIKQLSKLLQKGGKQVKVTRHRREGIDIRELSFGITVGPELRRLAMKISVAVADRVLDRDDILDPHARDYLLGRVHKSEHVRIDFQDHAELEKLRTPLSHLAYVKGNRKTGRCYAIVKFYGAIQLYVILNDKGYSGEDFAAMGLLDPVSNYQETIGPAQLYLLREAPIHANMAYYNTGLEAWAGKCSLEMKMAFGDQFGKMNFLVPPSKLPDTFNRVSWSFQVAGRSSIDWQKNQP